jgi:hypothetical protein
MVAVLPVVLQYSMACLAPTPVTAVATGKRC